MNEKTFTVDEAFRKVKSHLLFVMAENEQKESFLEVLDLSPEDRTKCLEISKELLKRCVFDGGKKSDSIAFLLEKSKNLAMFSLLVFTHFEMVMMLQKQQGDPLIDLMKMLTQLIKE